MDHGGVIHVMYVGLYMLYGIYVSLLVGYMKMINGVYIYITFNL